MRVQVLGCAGGIGGRALRTTSFLVDDDILLDAGTGAQDLTIEQLVNINHIFLTHAHLDHLCSIPFIADAINGHRPHPLIVHALPEVIEVMKKHLFNWHIWPDFTVIPSAEQPVLAYAPLQIGEPVTIDGRVFTAIPANHVVPAVGYRLQSESGRSLVFTGDTGPNEGLWPLLNAMSDVQYLVIENSFCDKERAIAEASKHLCPSMLAEELAQMTISPEVYVTHLKPGEIEATMDEIQRIVAAWSPRMLRHDAIFQF